MGRGSSYDDVDEEPDRLRRLLWLLLFALIAALVFQGATFAVVAYGVPICLVAGLIASEIRARLQFEEANKDDPLLAIEHDLRNLEGEQSRFRREKTRIYQHGDQLGLERRNSDGRFYDRGQGKVLNNQLARLDRAFEAFEDKILYLKIDATTASCRRHELIRHEKNRVALILAFRVGLGAYLASAALLAIVYPSWAESLSRYIAQTIWLQSPTFTNAYGPLAVASVFATVTLVACFLAKSDLTEELLVTDYLQEQRDDNIEAFNEPENVTEAANFDEKPTGAEGRDEQTPEDASPHEVLGVSPSASRDEILAAYRELVKQYHPDFQHGRGSELKELAEHKTQLLNWAKDAALKLARV